MSTLASTRQLTDLAPTLEGKVVLPEDAGFDVARQAWNLAVDQRPSMVVFPESPVACGAIRWSSSRASRTAATTSSGV